MCPMCVVTYSRRLPCVRLVVSRKLLMVSFSNFCRTLVLPRSTDASKTECSSPSAWPSTFPSCGSLWKQTMTPGGPPTKVTKIYMYTTPLFSFGLLVFPAHFLPSWCAPLSFWSSLNINNEIIINVIKKRLVKFASKMVKHSCVVIRTCDDRSNNGQLL